jgi:hypothetical protein
MPKQFVELSPEDVLKAVEGVEDILTPAFDKRAADIASTTCPDCGSGAIMKVDPTVLFKEGELLPDFQPFCPVCDKKITTTS